MKKIKQTQIESQQNGTVYQKKRFRITADDLNGYAFIAIALVAIAVFTIYPLISASITSFQDYKPFGSEFIGWQNYINTLQKDLFWKSLKNTVVYTAATVPASICISFTISVMIMSFKKKTQTIYKALFYLPAVTSAVVASLVWIWIYDSSDVGLLNQLMAFFGLEPQRWLTSSKTAMFSLILMALVSGQGTNIIIYIAALLGIDNTYYEAAEIDGANFLQKIFYIVIPQVKPTTLFLVITGIINSFQVFINAYLMTGGGPDNNTMMIGYLIFKNAFEYGEYGLACAQAIILTIIIAALTALLYKVSGSDVEY